MILAVGPLPPPYTGQSISFEMLVDSLKEKLVDVCVVNILPDSKRKVGRFSVLRLIDYVLVFSKYFQCLVSKKHQVVYITIAASTHGFIRDLLIIWTAFFLGNAKIICHIKGGSYGEFYNAQNKFIQFLVRNTLIKVDKLIVLSERLRNMFEFDTRLDEKIVAVSNGLPSLKPVLAHPKKIPDIISGESINIIYLSNLIESKGYMDVLRAISILVNTYKITNLRANFCGKFLTSPADDKLFSNENEAEDWFNDFVKVEELEKVVHFHGSVSGSTKDEFLKNSHIFILPTNYIVEGLPVSIIEAMAYGNVVISTDYRAIPDLVINEKTGFLVPYADPESIAKKILLLTENLDIYHQMSCNSIKHYQENFTREKHLDSLLPLLLPN